MAGKPVQQEAALGAEILRQQQLYLMHQIPTIVSVNALNGAMVAALFWNDAAAPGIPLWFSIVLGISLLQLSAFLKLRRSPAPRTVSGRSLKRSAHWSLVIGALWGSLCFVVWTPSVPDQMFLSVVIAGMTAGTTAVLNPLPQMTVRFVLGALSLLLLRMVLEAEPLHLTVAGLGIVFGVALIAGSLRAYNQFAGMIRLSFKLEDAKADLVDALESTKDAFALYDDAGNVSIANKKFRDWFPKGMPVPESTHSPAQIEAEGRWLQVSASAAGRGGHVAVYTDISALKQREAELVEAKLVADAANRAKTEFLANMSHELRTPLNAILGFSEMMYGEVFGPLGSPKYGEYTRDIQTSASHLLAIISDILDLTRIEASRYELSPEPVDMREAVESVAALCRHNARVRKKHTLEIDIAPELGSLQADARAFKQILFNLLDNAMKFTPEQGRLGVKGRLDSDGQPVLSIWDTGIGIPEEKLEWVRKPFHQLEGPYQRSFQGTGLGLSIADALVRLHGGTLTLSRRSEGGTVVTIRFPENLHARPAASRIALAAS